MLQKGGVINDQNFGEHGDGARNGLTIKFKTTVIKPNLCDYSDVYILVTGDIEHKPDGSSIAFKNCAPFHKSIQWNQYIVEHKETNATNTYSKLLDASFQGASRLFVLAFNNVAGNNRVEKKQL